MKHQPNKKLAFLFLLVLLLFLFTPFVLSLGVAPSNYHVDIKDGTIQDLTLRVLNSDGQAKRVLLQVQGDYASAVELPTNYVDFSSGETSKTLTYTLHHPSDVPSGDHIIDIVLLELPDESTQGTVVSVSNSVIQRIVLFSPYTGAFISGTLYVSEGDADEPLTFTVRTTNKGTQTTTVSGEVIIKGPLNNEIIRVPLSSKDVQPGENQQLVGVLSGLSNKGFYVAEALLFYGDKHIEIIKNFQVGSVLVEPISLEVEQFVLGEIVRVNIDARSEWNEDVDGVSAEVEVLDKSGAKISSFKTLDISVPAKQTRTLEGFWDTVGLTVGSYDLLVKLHYAGKTTEKLFSTAVGIDNLQVLNNQLSGNVISKGEGEGNPYSLLIMLVVILIVVNAAVLIYLSRKKKT